MIELEISDQDIESTEKLLLPNGAHFPEDARNVIRYWESIDVAACPGSGKTTVLLAKLKLLADRMPLKNGAGICVLSHTNVAVNEIRTRLSGYADKLLCYPNYIGTIQSFVDKFVTMPYLRNIAGKNVQAVDDLTYAQHVLNRMQKNGKYRAGKQRKALAGADKASTIQYKKLITDLLEDEGIMRYRDAYLYAEAAVNDLSEAYTDLFSSRFQYVFVDEYQDCNDVQRRAIEAIFNSTKCRVIKIGDSDQAIYNSADNETTDWVPEDGFLPIMTSCRYSQEIANVICKLKKDRKNIVTSVGKTDVKPVLFIFDTESIDRVIDGFINTLETHGLHDNKGVYKVIGAVRKEDSAGLKIGSYWSEFDGTVKKQSEYNYWRLIDDIILELTEGKLYKAERIVRKLICRLFHYAKIRHPNSEKDFTVITIKKFLEEEHGYIYRRWIYGLSKSQNIDKQTIDHLMRQLINELLDNKNLQADNIFASLPDYFLDESAIIKQTDSFEKNVLIDPIRGRRIEFDTIHGVKGETHDATLYLETDRQGASDLKRILPYYGVGKPGKSPLFDYSRKLAYVGMSRPRTLLCVAMQAETYEKSNGVFDNDWDIVDLRN